MVELELAGRVFVFDDGVAEKLGALNRAGWIKGGRANKTNPSFVAGKRDREVHEALRPKGRTPVSLGSMVYLMLHGKLPTDGLVYLHLSGQGHDFRSQNLIRVSRQTFAEQTLKTPRNSEGGVTRLPSGRYRARAYLDGKLRSVGTFDTRELAQAARAEAITKGVARTPASPPHQKKAQPQTLDQLRGRVAELEAEVERLGLLEKITNLEAELERLRSVLPS